MMRNRILVTIMVLLISILLLCASIIALLNFKGIDVIKLISVTKTKQEETIASINLDDKSQTIEQQITEKRAQNIGSSPDGNSTIMSLISSRSSVDRELYFNLDENAGIEKDYEEVKTYIPLDQVKISFDMDVSQPTGLSKEDFITLVTNMKKDKTGILEANAGVIWECCQKYNVNEIFVLGICGIESGWCSARQHQNTHNYASLMSGGKLIQYPSDAAGFEAMIKLLGQRYLTPGGGLYHGKTITGVGTSYCNPTSWPQKVYTCMKQVLQ